MKKTRKPRSEGPFIVRGKHRHVLDVDPALYPRQSKQLNAQPHGKKTEFVMRKMQQADTLGHEAARHEELVKAISQNHAMLCKIWERIAQGTITMQEVGESVKAVSDESQKTLNKLGRMARKL